MRIYRLLLRLYPASFRHEYGGELCEVYRQRRSDAPGLPARLGLWLDTLLELPASALQVHYDLLRQDLRYTARTLGKSPGFTLTAALVVALGIGATTASFSVAYHVLLRPLPFADPDRLVRLWQKSPGYFSEVSPPNYRDWKQMSRSFEAMAAYFPRAVNLAGRGEPRRLEMAAVTSDLLPILGIRPLLGRTFDAADDGEGAAGTVLLSHSFWQSQFGGDPGILGTKVLLDGAPHEIIGVMPAGFHFPGRETLIWTPLRLAREDFEDRGNTYLKVVARLRRDIPLERARLEMSGIAARLERESKDNARVGTLVNRIQEEIPGQSRLMLLALFGTSLCLLLIATSNLAGLMLTRALIRRKELALRSALGAGRERLTRQLMTESLALSALGGTAGLLISVAATPLLSRLVPGNLPIAGSPSLDLRVLSFAVALSALTGILFGVLPAMKACREAAADGLREDTRAGGGRKQRLRSGLVAAEVTASVVLLVSAGLLLRALLLVNGVDPGFRTAGVLTLRTALPIPKYSSTASRHAFTTRVLSEVRALPGVESAAYISYLPMVMGGGIWPVSMPGQAPNPEEDHSASLRYVTPGFFATLGIPLRAGRDVSESDTRQAPFVAVVSESFVRQYWPGQDAVGRRFNFAQAERTVVGVAGDIRVRGLEQGSEPQVYLSAQQVEDGAIIGYTPKDLVLRARGDPETLLPAIRGIVREADPEQPISDVRMLSDIVSTQTAPRQSQLAIVGIFAVLALLLAGIGLHGLLSYAVSQRTREIGIRLALGATRSDVLKMILRSGFFLAGAGTALGLVAAYGAGRGIEALLFGVPPADPLTYLAAAALALLMTLAGSLLPALRATRVDPTVAMHAE
jgi:putative ABC transport system permease protein